MAKSNSMVSKVFKNKYFPNSSILDAGLGSILRYVWKSIWGAKSIIVNDLIWRVGNGKSINLWSDKWTAERLDTAALFLY